MIEMNQYYKGMLTGEIGLKTDYIYTEICREFFIQANEHRDRFKEIAKRKR